MRITRLKISGVRCIAEAEISPSRGVNLIIGNNGAGKTSLLEALHLLAYGRSFRGRVRDGLVRAGADAIEVFAEWYEETSERHRRVGLRHTGQTWLGRLDGRDVQQLGDLCAALAVVTFEPGSHALVMGGAEPRRRLLDWGLFHVEQTKPQGGFLSLWRRYQRALKQRNQLLKAGGHDAQLEAWDYELAETGEPLTRHRQNYIETLDVQLRHIAGDLLPTMGVARVEFQPGWARDKLSLADALYLARGRDQTTGFTSVGPHRADWRVCYDALSRGETLSRGQAKLTALAVLLAQAQHHADHRGEWPVVILDDLASELDRNHQTQLLKRLMASQAQVFITGTEIPAVWEPILRPVVVFHVEHGSLTPWSP
ncbi:MAG: DNA replication/repair protein RecF [Lysobacteraceae bacterium]|nr:MAG: DNA replication/repair protein RecF [Xanthomonadaceae bacterium]